MADNALTDDTLTKMPDASLQPFRCAVPEAILTAMRERVAVPTAHARFPGQIRPTPRLWAEQMYNIVRWTTLHRGGHFAAFEQPALCLEDLRDFAAPCADPHAKCTRRPRSC